ncbi:MAG: hypothetical protein CMB80_03205 [Flammeovirgaceae bacterium]|nr:hypothetical protein [Flammeovirgaceae bacterium]
MINILKYSIKESNIHGFGIFVKQSVYEDEVIGVGIDRVFLFGLIFHIVPGLGTKMNHCSVPTARLVKKGSKYIVVANQLIDPYEEVTIDYADTPWFIRKPKYYLGLK